MPQHALGRLEGNLDLDPQGDLNHKEKRRSFRRS